MDKSPWSRGAACSWLARYFAWKHVAPRLQNDDEDDGDDDENGDGDGDDDDDDEGPEDEQDYGLDHDRGHFDDADAPGVSAGAGWLVSAFCARLCSACGAAGGGAGAGAANAGAGAAWRWWRHSRCVRLPASVVRPFPPASVVRLFVAHQSSPLDWQRHPSPTLQLGRLVV